jgi:quercetin dioxygenase-like cupin family protein
MTTTSNPIQATEVAVLERDQGQHLHFLNDLATVKVNAGTTGAISAVEFVGPRGFGPPLHSHREEDELIVVLDGEIAFRSGDDEFVATAGASAFLPHAVPHSFQVLSPTARFLSVTASITADAPRFDQMVSTLGAATDQPTLPEPGPIDPGHVALINDQHGIDILGPPPAPLTD